MTSQSTYIPPQSNQNPLQKFVHKLWVKWKDYLIAMELPIPHQGPTPKNQGLIEGLST